MSDRIHPKAINKEEPLQESLILADLHPRISRLVTCTSLPNDVSLAVVWGETEAVVLVHPDITVKHLVRDLAQALPGNRETGTVRHLRPVQPDLGCSEP